MTDMVLRVEDLTVEYRPLGSRPYQAVAALSFDVQAGSMTGIVGKRGSGKSTASLALLGLTRGTGTITAGSVSFFGQDILHPAPPAAAYSRWRHRPRHPAAARGT